jgi:hypothetical protein
MKKVWLVLLALLVVGTAGAQVWTTSAPANYKLEVPKNQYGEGYQGVVNQKWLFNGKQVKAGETYELEIAFKSNKEIKELMIVMVDGSEKANWWAELSSDWIKINDIPANTAVTQTITFTTIKGASDASARANQVVFDSNTANAAITLTFSKFVLKRIQ